MTGEPRLARLLAAAAFIVPAALSAQSDSATKLDPVVVTVTRGQGQSVLRSPFALSVTQPDSARPGQRHTGIDETLAMVPGMIVTNRNNPSQDARLSIRGFGARSTFGVRGVRILRDGMPLTLPDGQTPLDYLSLESVGRIEVMRGAASALYGNASGGVVDLKSEAPPATPIKGEFSQWLGDSGFSRTAVSAGGTSGSAFYQGDAALSKSDGARAHARQRATTGFGRAGMTFGKTEVSLLALALDNPVAQNPGPLTADEMRTNPEMADALSVRRDARKAARQIQVGLSATRPMGSGEAGATIFEGARSLDNPLTFAIVEVGRHTYGASAHASQAPSILGTSNRFVIGADFQSQNDLRRNYATCADTIPLAAPNETCPSITSERGVVTLDQRELVSSTGVYASDDIAIASRFDITAGVRADDVRFEVKDRLINASNPDDSGRRSLGAVSPVLGALMRIAPTHSLYANVASAFETPTATELGNHPDGSAGINQDLNPQRSITSELGIKGFFGTLLSYDLAAYSTGVKDELVPFEIPDSNGRRYFRNAGRTTRRGAEAGGQLSAGPVSLMGAYTLSAFRFDSYSTGGIVYDGNAIPGVPRNRWQTALKAANGNGFVVIEGEGAGAVFLDDANSMQGPGYTVANLRAGTGLAMRNSRLAVSAGIQNIFDRHYAASIAVNAARGKYFEPAATRNFFVGLSVTASRSPSVSAH
jgi:iron complex outermembrane recepter protein